MTSEFLRSARARVARHLGRLRARAQRCLDAATIDADDADERDLGYYYGARHAHLMAVRSIGLVLREGGIVVGVQTPDDCEDGTVTPSCRDDHAELSAAIDAVGGPSWI